MPQTTISMLKKLLRDAKVIDFDMEHPTNSDEKLPQEANFRINFWDLFNKYLPELARVFLRKLEEDVYRKIDVDCIVGFGDSGARLINAMIPEKKNFDLKDYRFAYVSKSADIANNILGDLQPGDKIAVIDEIGINYYSLLKGIAMIDSAMKYKMSISPQQDKNDKVSYTAVIVGLDLMVSDTELGKYKKDLARKQIKKLYNESNAEPEFSSILTIEECLADIIGPNDKGILEAYVLLQKEKIKKNGSSST